MERLSEEVKRRIVEHLACFRKPAEVSDLIVEEFGVEVTPRHVRVYDPTCFQFSGRQEWVTYHRHVRDRFAQEIGDIAIANRTYRLRKLDELYERAVRKGNLEEARKALEQAAKEVGDVYTNVNRSAGVIAGVTPRLSQYTPEERRNMLADRLRDGLERIKALPPPQYAENVLPKPTPRRSG